ncbi:Heterokaryon incompatibility protein het-c [Mycena kentingensis (nom. inval.)]|nr:Heterokaryon incompatibility protein het-c [Mycena kentingensis (nom. inval.)]
MFAASTLLIITVVLLVAVPRAAAFGAGDIPDFAWLNDKAFRHGDIENILATLAKSAGHASLAHAASGGNLLGFAKNLLETAKAGPGGAKFSGSDIKKVYFGNWLRDYSQAMDIAGLTKLTADTLVLVVSILGFMTFGFATAEFQVTADRLGVYLPVEHIDNPKGYAEKEGDARQFHPKLRPPVDPAELEIDEQTGMKCYMATENRGWDTSTALIRRVLVECIERGRRSQGQDGPDLYEAYRLLGTGLHTLEDLLAHSNWVEIALRKMGHQEVFCHVGEDTEIETPNGRAPPLVTGTFGSSDFLHSLMGEATDKLSQASVTDLADKLQNTQSDDLGSKISSLKAILSKLPIGGGDEKMQQGEQLAEESKAYNFDPDNVAPPEVQEKLLAVLRWRDDLMRSILEKMEMIPGLEELMEELSNALSAYVFTTIGPWLTPILQQATSALGEGSKAVIDQDDQYEVFNNPRASDPSHSLLSKDHFGLILNEPAGKIAILVVKHSVEIIVQAWSNNDDPNRAVDQILEAFHHPYYASGRSRIQNAMFEELERWLRDLDHDVQRETIQALTKESVREGKNKRLGSENESFDEPGYGGCGHGHAQPQRRPQGQQQQQTYGGGRQQQQQQYGGSQSTYNSGGGYNSQSQSRHEESGGYGGGRQSESYGQQRNEGYGQQREEYGSSRREDESGGYGDRRNEEPQLSYGRRNETESYGRQEQQSYGGGGGSGYEPNYGRQEQSHGRRDEDLSYGDGRNESSYGGGGGGYGRREEEQSYGRREEQQSYGRREEQQSYGRREEDSYGGRNESSYGRSEERSYVGGGGGYGSSERQEYGGGGGGYGGGRQEYGGGGGGRDETFGAERLNLGGDEEGYGERRHHGGGEHHGGHHGGRRHHEENEYESRY